MVQNHLGLGCVGGTQSRAGCVFLFSGLALGLLLHTGFDTSPEMSQMCVLTLVSGSCI